MNKFTGLKMDGSVFYISLSLNTERQILKFLLILESTEKVMLDLQNCRKIYNNSAIEYKNKPEGSYKFSLAVQCNKKYIVQADTNVMQYDIEFSQPVYP